MGQKSGPGKEPAGPVVKEIRRVTRRQFSAEEKIRIVLTGLQQQGTSAIWRINTATGALEFCTFSNVAISGATHIACQGNSRWVAPPGSEAR